LLQKVCGTLDHCFITTHSIHKEGDFQIYFCDITRSKAPHTGPPHIWRTYTLCPLFGRKKNTDSSTVGLVISLASVCYGDLSRKNIFCARTWSSNQSGVGVILALSSFLKFLARRSLKSRWVYLAPHEDNSIQLFEYCWIQKVEKQFCGPLEDTLSHRIAVGHTISIVDITCVPVVPFHGVRFHRAVAVITEISFCWWWVHVNQHLNFSSVLPN